MALSTTGSTERSKTAQYIGLQKKQSREEAGGARVGRGPDPEAGQGRTPPAAPSRSGGRWNSVVRNLLRSQGVFAAEF